MRYSAIHSQEITDKQWNNKMGKPPSPPSWNKLEMSQLSTVPEYYATQDMPNRVVFDTNTKELYTVTEIRLSVQQTTPCLQKISADSSSTSSKKEEMTKYDGFRKILGTNTEWNGLHILCKQS